uniref:Glycosyltransferase n=1 Tax=Oryza brachyantha TaxID=4533 RepID=J3M6Q8_ORYBR
MEDAGGLGYATLAELVRPVNEAHGRDFYTVVVIGLATRWKNLHVEELVRRMTSPAVRVVSTRTVKPAPPPPPRERIPLTSWDVAMLSLNYIQKGLLFAPPPPPASPPLLSTAHVTELSDGVFVGFVYNHALSDGTALWNFINAWAEIARARLAPTPALTSRQPPMLKRWSPDGAPGVLPYADLSEVIERLKPPPLRERMLQAHREAGAAPAAGEDASLHGGVPGGAQGVCSARAPGSRGHGRRRRPDEVPGAELAAVEKAAAFAAGAGNGTIVLAAVSGPYLPFLSNWLISVRRAGRADQVLVVAEDYGTLERINAAWPGHAVLVPPAPDAQVAHKFGSQGFFNFTSRRPRHLLQILELGYSVMYNDVDMVWLADPFPYIVGDHDVYFMDDMTPVKPLDHSHDLPPPGKKGRTYICSCMIFLRPTEGAKLLLRKWIEELKEQPWSKKQKANDQPAFNWALNKTAGQVDVYLLPQSAFPTGGLYFKNKTWVKETKGKHVIIHNNYITGFEKKIKRFRDHGLWLVDEHSDESPVGRI